MQRLDGPNEDESRLHGAALDARIRLAEMTVVARDARIRQHASALGSGLRSRVGIGLLGTAGVAVGGFLMARLLPSARRRRRTEARSRPELPPGTTGLGIAGLVAMVLPLIPIVVRSRMSPGTATALTSVGIPLLQRLIARRRRR